MGQDGRIFVSVLRTHARTLRQCGEGDIVFLDNGGFLLTAAADTSTDISLIYRESADICVKADLFIMTDQHTAAGSLCVTCYVIQWTICNDQ